MPNCLNKYFLIFILIWIGNTGYAQMGMLSDLDLIKQNNLQKVEFTKPVRVVKFMFTSNKNPIIRYNPVSLGFGGLMYFYQKIVSPQLATNCPYQYSCSNFSVLSIKRYGLIKGIALSADRLTRCNEISLQDLKRFELNDNYKIADDPEEYHQHK